MRTYKTVLKVIAIIVLNVFCLTQISWAMPVYKEGQPQNLREMGVKERRDGTEEALGAAIGQSGVAAALAAAKIAAEEFYPDIDVKRAATVEVVLFTAMTFSTHVIISPQQDGVSGAVSGSRKIILAAIRAYCQHEHIEQQPATLDYILNILQLSETTKAYVRYLFGFLDGPVRDGHLSLTPGPGGETFSSTNAFMLLPIEPIEENEQVLQEEAWCGITQAWLWDYLATTVNVGIVMTVSSALYELGRRDETGGQPPSPIVFSPHVIDGGDDVIALATGTEAALNAAKDKAKEHLSSLGENIEKAGTVEEVLSLLFKEMLPDDVVSSHSQQVAERIQEAYRVADDIIGAAIKAYLETEKPVRSLTLDEILDALGFSEASRQEIGEWFKYLIRFWRGFYFPPPAAGAVAARTDILPPIRIKIETGEPGQPRFIEIDLNRLGQLVRGLIELYTAQRRVEDYLKNIGDPEAREDMRRNLTLPLGQTFLDTVLSNIDLVSYLPATMFNTALNLGGLLSGPATNNEASGVRAVSTASRATGGDAAAGGTAGAAGEVPLVIYDSTTRDSHEIFSTVFQANSDFIKDAIWVNLSEEGVMDKIRQASQHATRIVTYLNREQLRENLVNIISVTEGLPLKDFSGTSIDNLKNAVELWIAA